MENEPSVQQPQEQELQTWHKPEVERLVVSLDTKFNTGSAIDGGSGSTPG